MVRHSLEALSFGDPGLSAPSLLIVDHGVLAPPAGRRAAVVIYGVARAVARVPAAGVCSGAGARTASDVPSGSGVLGESGAAVRSPRRGWTWAHRGRVHPRTR